MTEFLFIVHTSNCCLHTPKRVRDEITYDFTTHRSDFRTVLLSMISFYSKFKAVLVLRRQFNDTESLVSAVKHHYAVLGVFTKSVRAKNGKVRVVIVVVHNMGTTLV
jgi:hypothetical protein